MFARRPVVFLGVVSLASVGCSIPVQKARLEYFPEGMKGQRDESLPAIWRAKSTPDPEFAIYFESPVELHRLNGRIKSLEVWMNEEDGSSDALGRIYFDIARPPWSRPMERGDPKRFAYVAYVPLRSSGIARRSDGRPRRVLERLCCRISATGLAVVPYRSETFYFERDEILAAIERSAGTATRR